MHRILDHPEREMRSIATVALLTMAAACSTTTAPIEPVTFDSIAGHYTLVRVGTKTLPASLGVCSIPGCVSVGKVVSGTFDISSELAGQWTATINEVDETTGAARSRVYNGAGAAMASLTEIEFSVANATDPLFSRWSGRVAGNTLFVTINVFDYEFQRNTQ